MRLSDKEIQGIVIKDRPYKRADGGGLYIQVMPTGSKYWRIKYHFEGRERTYAIGVYPEVSLQEARKIRNKVKRQVKEGIDPAEVKRQEVKNRPKPKSRKNEFDISMSGEGVLTIETATRIIHLQPGQVKALRSFLQAIPEKPESEDA